MEIINFDDLQCPYCGMLNNEILPQTMNRYKGLVKIVYKDYPLKGHPWAMRAAVDANCLASQSDAAYWAYVDYVHGHGQDISGANPNPAKSFTDLDNIAGTIGKQSKVDETQLALCLKKAGRVGGEFIPEAGRFAQGRGDSPGIRRRGTAPQWRTTGRTVVAGD